MTSKKPLSSEEKLMVATGVIFLVAVLVGLYIKGAENQKSRVQFPAQVAEQNRQADVASQLRAAERRDLVLLVDGRFWLVHENEPQNETIALSVCSYSHGGFISTSTIVHRAYRQGSDVKMIKGVLKYYPGSSEYTDAAYNFFGNDCNR